MASGGRPGRSRAARAPARSTSSTSPPRIAARGCASSENASAAARSWRFRGSNEVGRSSVNVAVLTASLQPLEGFLARGFERFPQAAMMFRLLGDTRMPELVENRDVFRNAPDQRADQRSGQHIGLELPLAEELAVQHRVLQHADLLGRGQGAFEPGVLSGLGGRASRRSAKVWSRMSSIAGGRSTSNRFRASSSRVRNRTISFSVALLVTMGIDTKLNRRLRAVERSLTPRSRALAVAMMLKPGRAKTTLSSFSSGIVMYFSERIEINASCTSLLQRVSSSNRPIRPCCMEVMIGEGIMLSRDWPAAMTIATFHEYLIWSSVVPAVPWMTWVLLPQIAAASSSASQLLPVPGSPIRSRPRSLARVTIARSTVPASPKNLGWIGRSSLSEGDEPSTKIRTSLGDRTQLDGRGPPSIDRSQSSSSAYLTSAGSRRTFSVAPIRLSPRPWPHRPTSPCPSLDSWIRVSSIASSTRESTS